MLKALKWLGGAVVSVVNFLFMAVLFIIAVNLIFFILPFLLLYLIDPELAKGFGMLVK